MKGGGGWGIIMLIMGRGRIRETEHESWGSLHRDGFTLLQHSGDMLQLVPLEIRTRPPRPRSLEKSTPTIKFLESHKD